MQKRDGFAAVAALLGAVFGGFLAYRGAIEATEVNLEFQRLSSAYASYVSSVAQNVSGGDLESVIEAKSHVALYGHAEVVETLAQLDKNGHRLCDGDWFFEAIADMRSEIGRSELAVETVKAVLCGGEPLTARFDGVPREHDGDTPFTFDMHFSEVFPLSYLTLRDSAFAVANGEVTRARRIVRESNQHWRITVAPARAGDITILLPGNRACDAAGAICTALGKQLSNSPEATVRSME